MRLVITSMTRKNPSIFGITDFTVFIIFFLPFLNNHAGGREQHIDGLYGRKGDDDAAQTVNQ